MGAGKQTVFLLPVPSGALRGEEAPAKLDFTQLGLSTLALFALARAGMGYSLSGASWLVHGVFLMVFYIGIF
jgi:hypothetical protein